MSGERKVEEYLSDLEKLHEEVREHEELSEKIREAKKAVKIYADFREKYREDGFEVHFLQANPDGTVEEKPYDWKALDNV